MTAALVVGAAGQDGVYLRRHLQASGRRVLAVSRTELWEEGGARSAFSIFDAAVVADLFRREEIGELYYLPAYHHAAEVREGADERLLWERSFAVHLHGWVNCLEAIRAHRPSCRAFYAGSSLLFGSAASSPQSEETPFQPRTIYGISKLAGVQAGDYYRDKHSLFVSTGILYNHESPFRPETFVSQKIVQGLKRIQQGTQQELVLGDPQAEGDWGSAVDFVAAMPLILAAEAPGHFVIATGQKRKVIDFVDVTCNILGMKGGDLIREDPRLLRAGRNRTALVGNSAKLRRITGWEPRVSFEEMIKSMVRGKEDIP